MNTRRVLNLGLLMALALTGCAAGEGLSEQLDEQTARINAIERQLADLAVALDELRNELEAGLMEVEAPIEQATAEAHTAQVASPFDVAVAQYFMDSADLHAMDVALNEGGEIDAAYGPNVTRLVKVLSNTIWPEELESAVAAFVEQLEAFSTALANDDLATAAPLATAIHDAQHDLSHAIGAWLGSEAAELGHDEQ